MKVLSRIVVLLLFVSLAGFAIAQTDSLSALIERAQAAMTEDAGAIVAVENVTNEVSTLEAQTASAQARQSQSAIRLENAALELAAAEAALNDYWATRTLDEKLAILSAYSDSVAVPITPVEPAAPVELPESDVDPPEDESGDDEGDPPDD